MYDYILKNKWFENSKYIIHEGERKSDSKVVLLKTSKAAFPTQHELNQLKIEYSLLKRLENNSILEAIDIIPNENSLCIVMSHPKGDNLLSVSKEEINLDFFLKIAINLVEAVSFVHSKRIIHTNLNLSNIYVDKDKGNVQLAGFEHAKELAREGIHSNSEEAFEVELAYISPEQTGRMNRTLDQRTDLYSLGAILYHVLAQRPPFVTDDSLEMIHCHIAKKHIPLKKISNHIPAILSDIIDKLLEKNTDKRYQSTAGLKHDLQYCRDHYQTIYDIQDYTLGTNDVSDRFTLSGNLHGRTEDLKNLQERYEKARNGFAGITLVSGPSGMGKSSLVNEVKKYIDQSRGFFIHGKFDQIKQNTPLNSLLSAFTELIRQILTESEHQIAEWRAKVLEAVGSNGAVLTDVIPEIKLLIGEQAPLRELPPSESTTRFNLIFHNFVQVFTKEDRPLCIFLDDLQWIDYATCQWIETQFSNQQLKYFFLIGAYRDNEVSPSHPLMLMLDQLEQIGVSIHHIKLAPLNTSSIANLIGESINLNPKECQDIAEIIAQKTNGNPFFIRQILLSLYEKNAIYFNNDKRGWAYDLNLIKETNISENVLELMLELLHRLPKEVLDSLKIASCIGGDFDSNTLSELQDIPVEKANQQLAEAIHLGLIIAKGKYSTDSYSEFSFQHDKIQQATFSLLSEEERKINRLKIARLLLQKGEGVSENDKIYEIADHYNAAIDIIRDRDELAKLIELNLAASVRAQSATAYEPALDYIKQAMELMDTAAWNTPTKLTRDLYVQRAESEHLCGKNDTAALYFDKAIAHATSDLDKAKVYLKKIHYYNNLGKFPEAYETGRIAINPLGISLPAQFVPPKLIADIVKYRVLRGRRRIKDLIHVKEMTDEKLIMAMLLLANVTKSSYQIKPELSIAVSAKIVNLTLQHGHSDGSCIGFVAFGAIFHGAILNMKKAGYEFGQLTLDLVDKYKLYQYKSEIHFVVGYFAIPWFQPALEMERYWKIAYNAGLEVGDFFHSSCAACGTIQSYFMRGQNCNETLKAADRYLDFLYKINYSEGISTIKGVQQSIKNLQGKTLSRSSYSDNDFNEEDFVKNLSNYGSRHFAHYYYINKMRTLYLWGELESAYEMMLQSDSYLNDSPGMLHTAEHFFYKGLILAALYPKAKGSQRWKWKRTLQSINNKFKTYSKNSPSNFIHKSQIIDAEYHRIHGEISKSQSLYYSAIESSKKYGYLHVQALANQLLTLHHLSEHNSRIAGFHLRDAVYDYYALGSEAYADYLSEKFSEIAIPTIEKSLSTKSGILAGTKTTSSFSNIDLTTILKSSEAISQQIRLKDLLSVMMKIIIENAGAQRMVLLLKEGDKLLVHAECIADTQEVQILSKVPLSEFELIPKSVINYVINANEPVILADATKSEKFGMDSYITTHQARSVLCAPLSKMGKTIGAIYLENNLSDQVFTQQRIDLIILLSGQMAISIDNALLYENLEEKVKERTEQLNIEKEKSENLLLNILPANIAWELKTTGKADAKHFKQVTVLFADFQNFSKICENLSADELVKEINYFYSAFDKIIMKYNIEKIKTIGDCYMCAGSLPTEKNINPHPVISAALEIRQFMNEEIEKRINSDKPSFNLRIGMHTGPVVAGIVGLKKFAYDIWGDAVNIASRMESNGEVGKINISGDTYALIKDDFNCTYRGKIEVKNKGMIDMYFVENYKLS